MSGPVAKKPECELGQRWLRLRNALPAVFAGLLVAAGLFLAVQREEQALAQRASQTTVQAQIVAAAVAGAVAFDDEGATREYLGSLKLNPDIRAAAVYSHGGALVAGFSKDRGPLPRNPRPQPAVTSDLTITVVEPIRQGTLELGAVYVKASIEPVAVRLSRYMAIGLLIAFAALLIYLLGRSYARMAAANQRLVEEIAAREQAETALVQAQKMEAVGQLTGGVAHDFNNLLMAASSGLALLERTTDPDRRRRLQQGVREALDRGAHLTRQLLTFARRSPINAEVVALGDQLEGLRGLLARSLRENVEVDLDLAPDLWPVVVDPTQLDVAIVNIAVNARDAMPRGGRLAISLANAPGALDGADAVRIDIADEGSGMSPQLVAKVFEPFFTTKPIGQGTGLGLSQVYGFIQSSGGRVDVRSELGSGTTMTLLLPRATQGAAPAQRLNGVPAERPVKSRRVLVVEDDDGVADTLCEMLRDLGCQTTRAGTAEDALGLAAQQPVDLVLTDMVMPGRMTGLELAKALRGRPEPVPVVLMTGFNAAAVRAQEAGFRLLNKPFTLDELAAALG